jgi:hypothetical protein
MSDLKLGDKVESVTQALGIETCAECQSRKERLNHWSRRGFVGLLGAIGATLAMPFTKLGDVLAGNIDATPALLLSRLINTAQTMQFEETGEYYSTSDLLVRLAQVKAKGTGFRALTPQLDPSSREIMTGWTLDHVPNPNGYVFVLTYQLSASYLVFVSDATGAIYEGTVPAPLAASSLDTALAANLAIFFDYQASQPSTMSKNTAAS